MYTYAVTFNPSPYMKWNRASIARYCNFGITAACYNKLPKYLQKELCQSIFEYLKKSSIFIEWSDPRFELTEKGNYHLHAMFTCEDELTEQQLNSCCLINILNGDFSCGQKHKAIYIEKTIVDKNYWLTYQNKDILLHCDLPDDDDDNNIIPPSELIKPEGP